MLLQICGKIESPRVKLLHSIYEFQILGIAHDQTIYDPADDLAPQPDTP